MLNSATAAASAFSSAALSCPARALYSCEIPWAILLDPTNTCNLHCTGCWTSQRNCDHDLSFEEIDSIIAQGKKLGVHFYIYNGGEPLLQM